MSAATRVHIIPAPVAISDTPRFPPAPLPEFLPDGGGVEQPQPGLETQDWRLLSGDLGHVLTLARNPCHSNAPARNPTLRITVREMVARGECRPGL